MIDWSQRQDSIDFLGKALDCDFSTLKATWLTSVTPDGNILGVVAYSSYWQGNCEIHAASVSPRWVTPQFLRAAFAYPFLQLACNRITAKVLVSNKRSLDHCFRLGFVIEGCQRQWNGSDDLLVLGMLRGECKWVVEAEHRQPLIR